MRIRLQQQLLSHQIYRTGRKNADVRHILAISQLFNHRSDCAVTAGNYHPVNLFLNYFRSNLRYLVKEADISHFCIFRSYYFLHQLIGFIHLSHHTGKKLLTGITVIQKNNLFKFFYVYIFSRHI